MPVTFWPPNQTSPEVGRSRPAISCISVVLPASVVPSSTLNVPGSRTRLVSWIWTAPPTRFATFLSSRAIGSSDSRDVIFAQSPGCTPVAHPGVFSRGLLVVRPALDQLVIGDGLALGLLIVEFGLRRVVLA